MANLITCSFYFFGGNIETCHFLYILMSKTKGPICADSGHYSSDSGTERGPFYIQSFILRAKSFIPYAAVIIGPFTFIVLKL